MAAETDWLGLWRDLATLTQARSGDWAKRYESHGRRKIGERPDPLLDFILPNIGRENTVLDIGAGSGRWAIPVARLARSVTAVEPSSTMLEILQQNIAESSLDNIRVMPVTWQEASVEPHDIIVSAHAMYSSPDLAAFVGRVQRLARERCYLALRLPVSNGVIGELCLAIYGHRHDSPNAVVAYNALYSMGIYANVLVEESIELWEDATFEDAFTRARRALRLGSSTASDKLIRDTLTRRLTYSDNRYLWPDGMRSALLWWNTAGMVNCK